MELIEFAVLAIISVYCIWVIKKKVKNIKQGNGCGCGCGSCSKSCGMKKESDN